MAPGAAGAIATRDRTARADGLGGVPVPAPAEPKGVRSVVAGSVDRRVLHRRSKLLRACGSPQQGLRLQMSWVLGVRCGPPEYGKGALDFPRRNLAISVNLS